MSSRIIAVDPFDLVVFGGTGDLAYRKLLPAMYHRHRDKQIPKEARIIGVSRRGMSDDQYRAATATALQEHVSEANLEPEIVQSFLARLHFVSVDALSESGWTDLAALLDDGRDRVRAFYLAVDPSLFGRISARIGEELLVTPKTRVIIEKPIG
ncbi:MAG: glucose-6-phosphate dehydrogenase, partial [Bauldia sp.]|nr:glucose-6-phosphate dehydrogenase [Bauldia sp.]